MLGIGAIGINAGICLALLEGQASGPTIKKDPTFRQKLELQRGFGVPIDKRPALFSYDNGRSNGLRYAIEAELKYAREPIGDQSRGLDDYRLGIDVAANLAHDSDGEDALQFEVSVDRVDRRQEILSATENANATKFYRLYKLSYQTDRQFDSQKLAFAPRWTIISLPNGVGGFSSRQGSGKPVYLSFEPVVGFDVGQVFDRGQTNEKEGALFRLTGTFTVNAWLPKLNTMLYAEDTPSYLPRQGGNKGFNQIRTGARIYLNKEQSASLVAEYKFGADAPEFKRVDVFRIAFGVRF